MTGDQKSFTETGQLVSIYNEGDERPPCDNYSINVAGLDVTWLISWMPEYAEYPLGDFDLFGEFYSNSGELAGNNITNVF